jgi:hypothetical protein
VGEIERSAHSSDAVFGWWAVPLEPTIAGEMARKYATLLKLVRDRDRVRRDRGLRAAAGRWPGSLRECQRVHPDLYVRRLRACRQGAAAMAVARAAWRDRGYAAIPLWAELHTLLADQLGWRASAQGASDVRAFVAALGESASTRWPAADVLVDLAGTRLQPRHAYGWLARCCGLSRGQLEGVLSGA